MWRGLSLVLLLLAGSAGATPPELSITEQFHSWFEVNLEGLLVPCSNQATSDGVHGAVTIEVVHGEKRPRALRILKAYHLGKKQIACIEEVVRSDGPAGSAYPAIARGPVAGKVRRPSYPIGAVRPLLDGKVLSAWRRIQDGQMRSGLRALLPPEIRISRAGCLEFRGPAALAGGFYAWLRQSGHDGHPLNIDPEGDLRSVASYFPLSETWWFRVRDFRERPGVSWRLGDHDGDAVACLEKVSRAVSAVWREHEALWRAASSSPLILDAEWVVDEQGRITGEVRPCYFQEDSQDGPPWDWLRISRKRIIALLGRIDFGKRSRPERVHLRFGPNRKMQVTSSDERAAPRPRRLPATARCPDDNEVEMR
jgi:hypothetical protein